MLRTYAAPDLSRQPPTAPTDAMLRPVPPHLQATFPAPGAAPSPPGVQAGVSVQGPRQRLNACIVLGFDGSGSIHGDQNAHARNVFGPDPRPGGVPASRVREQMFAAQLLAVANALRDPIVQDYALAGPDGGIAVLPLQVGYAVNGFFSPDARETPACEGWAVLDSREKMNAYADRLLTLRRSMMGGTQIGEVVSAAADAMATCPAYAQRRHVNVLVQGRDNEDGAPQGQVASAASAAVETNIHGLDMDPTEPMDRTELDPYYQRVVGMHGRMEWMGRMEDYVDILRRQLAPGL